MLHKSKLAEHAEKFPQDAAGNVPEPHDHWSAMQFEHGEHDPEASGIDEAERAKRTKYLDEHWWPQVIAQVETERDNLLALPAHSPIRQWAEMTRKKPIQEKATGFAVDEIAREDQD